MKKNVENYMETGGIYPGSLCVGAIVIKSRAVLWLAPLLRYPEEHYGLVVGKKNLAYPAP